MDYATARAMPHHCPACRALLGAAAPPHCTAPACPWVTCTACHATVSAAGRWVRRIEDGTWQSWGDAA